MRTERGNGWEMLCGDCLEVLPTIDAVDHVVTDPPYTQRTSDNARKQGGRKLIDFDGVDGLEPSIAREGLRVARRWVIAFCALEQIGEYARAAGDAWIRAGVWVRTNGMPQLTGDRPGQGSEGVAIMHRSGRKRWNGHGRPATWTGGKHNSVGVVDQTEVNHPTPKPVWLMIEIVADFTDPGETVLDPFAGSGTTGVACLRLGRRFVGIEKSEKYFSLAVERLRAEENQMSLAAARSGQMPLFGGAS